MVTKRGEHETGGAGEIYRALWSKNYQKSVGNPKNVFELSERLVNSLPLVAGGEYQASLKKLISDELELLPGNSPLEKLENYYVYFRNRYIIMV